MKFAAFILLTCFISYLTETVKIPLSFDTNCKKTMSCHKMAKAQCMKKPFKKPAPGNSKSCNPNCTNCPFTSVTIFEFYKSSFNLIIRYKKEYPPQKNFVLSDYASKTWKPPNKIPG